jgi:hypothetical protein
VPGRRQLLEVAPQPIDLPAQVVAGGDLTDRDPQGSQFASQELGVRLGLGRPGPVVLQADPVAIVLAVLASRMSGAA